MQSLIDKKLHLFTSFYGFLHHFHFLQLYKVFFIVYAAFHIFLLSFCIFCLFLYIFLPVIHLFTLISNFTSLKALKIVPKNGTARLKKCKQLFEYQHLLLLRDIWWSKFKSILICCPFFQHQSLLEICGSLRQLFSCIGVYYVLFHFNILHNFFCFNRSLQLFYIFQQYLHFFSWSFFLHIIQVLLFILQLFIHLLTVFTFLK
jgi:hypothetical protein